MSSDCLYECFDQETLERFVDLSAKLTGFCPAELYGTGMEREYYDELTGIICAGLCDELLNHGKPVEDIMASPVLAPLARNIIRMWYLGRWRKLPEVWKESLPYDWRTKHDPHELDRNHIVSARAYQEGLVWVAIGSHPMGAKQPGFGTWRFKVD